MLTVEAALELVLHHTKPLPTERVPLASARGQVLREDIASDIDSPPHDKSIVDGYAIRSADLGAGTVEFDVIEEVMAGQVPSQTVSRGQATRIMTGAPIPPGADAVVMVERTTLIPAESPGSHVATVRIESVPLAAGQNIMRRGVSMRTGDIVLSAGCTIRPIEIGVLAEVGRTTVTVSRQPTVAVLATGDELVPAERVPAAGQIRNSNGPMLLAMAEAYGAKAIDLGIARDEAADLRARIEAGLQADVLVLSGGVSAGVLDLVPGILSQAGVEEVFHKIRLKPGKPLWFGKRVSAEGRATLVFGLPGNPVSSLVCFALFVQPAIGSLNGNKVAAMQELHAPLANRFEHRGDRPTYHPARLVTGKVETLQWRGSGDLRTLTDANALVMFAAGERTYEAGETVPVLLLG